MILHRGYSITLDLFLHQERPREVVEQIVGIPGLKSILDNFDIAVETWRGICAGSACGSSTWRTIRHFYPRMVQHRVLMFTIEKRSLL